ncbi:MAG: bifunctional adenosylcobinamide kinase/adenosylcobinamide-phosphate guanylyltransferase [Desulfosalsimonadaceae bacterium]
MKNRLTLITGGCKSGKSRYALKVAESFDRKVFIATAQAFDGEMKDRIKNHRAERGDDFTTIEEPLDLAGALGAIPSDTRIVIIDCITVWLGNLMHYQQMDRVDCLPVEAFLNILRQPPCHVVVVSNEVGMGLVPVDGMSRVYRDMAGALNQRIAALSDNVFFVVSGLALPLRETKDR